VRLWQVPPEPLPTGGLPLLALALISAVTEAERPGMIVWAAYILLGLRYSAHRHRAVTASDGGGHREGPAVQKGNDRYPPCFPGRLIPQVFYC
jgi:hypothetical protein